jgi:hypothetical protein
MIPRRKPLAACSTMYDHAVAAKEKSRDERERDDDGGKEDVSQSRRSRNRMSPIASRSWRNHVSVR